MDVAQKVASLEGKVCGDHNFLARGRGEDGTVVADAQSQRFGPQRRGARAYAFDQGKLGWRGAGFRMAGHGLQDNASWLVTQEREED